jgi:deazaflavin-dependent oxidoreductase (nitroreductase family)
MSRGPQRLLSWGVPMGPLLLLRTRGRRTGLPRVLPVAVLRFRGERWLVSPFGETAWVKNARADGRAELGRGRHFRAVRLTEVDDARKGEILMAYRRRFRIVPFVREAYSVTSARDRRGIEAEAGLHPVFHVGEATVSRTQDEGAQVR